MANAVTPYSDGDIFDAVDANWVAGFGDGSDGAFSENSGTINVVRDSPLQYTSFLLDTNATLSAAGTSTSPVIIYVQGNVTINGTISLSGKGCDQNVGYGTLFATPGKINPQRTGGLRVEYANYQNGNKSIILNGTGGGSGGNSEDGGGGGASSQANGSDGENASGSSSAGAVGVGGPGGATLFIICGGTLTFGASSSIDTSGANGGNATGSNDWGGGGGGGSGDIIIIHRGAKTDNGLSTDVSASTGGNGIGTGGVGGNGAAGNVNIVDWATVGF